MFLSSMVPNVLYVVITMIIFITLSHRTRDEEENKGPLAEILNAPRRKSVFRKRKIYGRSTGNRSTNPFYDYRDFGPNSMPSKNWPYPNNKESSDAQNRVRRRIEDFTRGQNFNDEGFNSS